MEVLAAFIGEHSRVQWPVRGPGAEKREHTTRPDVQAAISVIGAAPIGLLTCDGLFMAAVSGRPWMRQRSVWWMFPRHAPTIGRRRLTSSASLPHPALARPRGSGRA